MKPSFDWKQHWCYPLAYALCCQLVSISNLHLPPLCSSPNKLLKKMWKGVLQLQSQKFFTGFVKNKLLIILIYVWCMIALNVCLIYFDSCWHQSTKPKWGWTCLMHYSVSWKANIGNHYVIKKYFNFQLLVRKALLCPTSKAYTSL
jgi:hypothetical protein